MISLPETRYAKSGDTYIAYQVMGNGPFDLVLVPAPGLPSFSAAVRCVSRRRASATLFLASAPSASSASQPSVSLLSLIS
jgi:hypothetical protein